MDRNNLGVTMDDDGRNSADDGFPRTPAQPKPNRLPSLLITWLAPIGVAAVAAVGVVALDPDQGVLTGMPTFQLCSQGPLDGDTIWYQGVKIRLADIDTPEVGEPKCALEAKLGKRATLRLLELMNAGPFTVVRSATAMKTDMGASSVSSSAMAGQ
jgi:hypothetical protein